jgi:hypothetical protein
MIRRLSRFVHDTNRAAARCAAAAAAAAAKPSVVQRVSEYGLRVIGKLDL